MSTVPVPPDPALADLYKGHSMSFQHKKNLTPSVGTILKHFRCSLKGNCTGKLTFHFLHHLVVLVMYIVLLQSFSVHSASVLQLEAVKTVHPVLWAWSILT